MLTKNDFEEALDRFGSWIQEAKPSGLLDLAALLVRAVNHKIF
jgi:hypothetical protein